MTSTHSKDEEKASRQEHLETSPTTQSPPSSSYKDGPIETSSCLDALSPPDPPPPPPPELDGGTRAWLQVVGSFLVFANLWAPSFVFGSFQSYYTSTYLPNETASDISWIGTFNVFLLVFGGVISGPLFDMGYFRTMLLTGALLETLGLFLVSLCDKYWELFLTQAVVMGIGNALLYIPGLTLVGRSFKKNRSIAMSITTCGAPVGGIVYTLMFEQLLPKIGFASTVRAMAYFMLGTFCISFPFMLWGARNLGSLSTTGTKRKLFDKNALTDVPFWAFSAVQFFNFLGYLVPFLYFPSFGQFQIGQSQKFSFTINIIAQASSIVGRMLAGYLANRFGVMAPWVASAIGSGIYSLGWAGVVDRGGYITIAILYGCFSGGLIPLPPSIFPVVCPDPKILGTWMGMAQVFSSLGSLCGSPIAGALIGAGGSSNRYLGLQLFAGLSLITGGCCGICLWVLLVRKRGTKKKLI